MIFFKLKGRSGNQLFQLAYLALLIKEKSVKIYLTNSFVLDIDLFEKSLVSNFIPNYFEEKFLMKLFFRIFSFRKIVLTSCLYEVGLLSGYGDVFLQGYFQNGRLYSGNREYLLRIFQVKFCWVNRFFSKYGNDFHNYNVLTIQIRKGDYNYSVFSEIDSNGILPDSWFEKALDYFSGNYFDKIYLISDSPEQISSMNVFSKLEYSLEINSPQIDFLLMLYSPNLIISNSSFAWWGGFLNQRENKKVIAPVNWVGYNVGYEYPKGIMIDDFIWI